MADNITQALGRFPEDARAAVPVLFTAHSIPTSMADGCRYGVQLAEACRLVAEQAGVTDWKLVYQSRSGPPTQPWLEPDICDAIRDLHARGGRKLVIAPIGFISDHMEVLYDLDTEAADLCHELGIEMVRSATVGTDPVFIGMVRDLIAERVRAMVEQDRAVPVMGMPVTVGVPTTLLRRRPDVIAAERELQAATADIGIAEAGYLPRFTFTGNFIIQSPDFSGLSNISNNMTYGIAPAVSWNFMNILTGAAEARVTQAKARAADSVLRYQLAVVKAINQVESSIATLEASRRQHGHFDESTRQISSAFDLAFMQYNAGTIDISQLINFLQAFVVARNGLAQAQGLMAQSTVELYRSLGGGWENTPMPSSVEDVKRFNPTPTANDFLAPSKPAAAPTNG
jgi:hypothetical protein